MINNDENTSCADSFLNEKEIYAAINFLNEKMEKIDQIEVYPDKWLLFQDPSIYDGWLRLIYALQNKRFRNDPEEISEWKKDTEKYVLYLLKLRRICIDCKDVIFSYSYEIQGLLDDYVDWIEGDSISKDGIEAMVKICGEEFEDTGNVRDLLLKMNNSSRRARHAVYSALCDNFDILMPLMNLGRDIVCERQPYLDMFAEAINNALILYTKQFGNDILADMKDDINRIYKNNLIEPTTRLHWAEMLKEYDQALKMAINKELAKCETAKQEHWDRHQPKDFLDENSKLISRIYEICKTEEFIDLKNFDNVQSFLSKLNQENIELFYDIIVSRRLIQCEIYPDLKKQQEAWLNGDKEQNEDAVDKGLDAARQSKLAEIIGILQKGNWKQPATAENIELLLNTVFGKDTSLLDEGDVTECEKMWALVEKTRGKDKITIVAAKLAGFIGREQRLMTFDGPKSISDDLFGKKNNQVNAINKGKKGCSDKFDAVIPFLEKYIDRIIRQNSF